MAIIQKSSGAALKELLKNDVVQRAVERMTKPAKKSGTRLVAPPRLWAACAFPLRLSRDQLMKLGEQSPNLKSVHLNRKLHIPPLSDMQPLGVEQSDICFSTWGLEKINALAAWGVSGARGEGVTVGLLDTGVDPSHPDLLDGDDESKVVEWEEFDDMGRPLGTLAHDSDEHGTHCAGTIVGGTASGRHIGVAPNAKIAAALVLNGDCGGTDAQVLRGIDWCLEQEVDVISMSLGGLEMDSETPPTYTDAILECLLQRVPVVAAIGNDGNQTSGSPGSDLFALSIGATDVSDRPAGFSGGRTQIIRANENIDPRYLPLPYSKPDLCAPGVAVYSCVPSDDWKAFNGTSMSAPHVAGAIALLLSATRVREFEAGHARTFLIHDLIRGSVDDMGESGQDHRHGSEGSTSCERLTSLGNLITVEFRDLLTCVRIALWQQRISMSSSTRKLDSSLMRWWSGGAESEAIDLIVEAAIPATKVAFRKTPQGKWVPSGIAPTNQDSQQAFDKLEQKLRQLLGDVVPLRSAKAFAIRATPPQLLAVLEQTGVRFVRPNRRLRVRV